jgi:hypothetical protein
MENTNNIVTSLNVPSLLPLDAKTVSLSEATLKNLGPNNHLAYTYFDSLHVICQLEKTVWEWREVEEGDTLGLLDTDFTYPDNIIVNGINYSLKSYNFFLPKSLVVIENTGECNCGTLYPFGTLVLEAKGVNNCTPNTGTQLLIGKPVANGKLEIGDLVKGYKDLNTYWVRAKYLGGPVEDKDNNYEPLLFIDLGTNCEVPPLDVDAVVSEWSLWSECIEGSQSRTRTVVTEALGIGTTPSLEETRSCTIPIVSSDATVSEWSEWSECTDSVQFRTRTVIIPAVGEGVTPDLIEERSCVMPIIDADAVLSEWSAWSECTDNLQTRTRTIITPATGAGNTGSLSEEQACGIPTYVTWNFSDLTQSVADAGTACTINGYPHFLYSEPFDFFDVDTFYVDTALTVPFVGDNGYYGVLKSGIQYSVQMNPSGYGSNKAICS